MSGDTIRRCWLVTVDINGAKKGPNQLGRDTFHYYITDDTIKLRPRPHASTDYCGRWVTTYSGLSSYNESCNPNNSSSTDKACANRIIRNGWKMDY